MKTLVLWLSFFVCIIGGSLLEGLHLKTLAQPTAAIMVWGPVLMYLLYCRGKDFRSFLKRIVAGEAGEGDRQVMETACAVSYFSGTLSVVIGIIHVLSNLSDTSKLGAGIAVAFVSVIYAAVPSLLLLPALTNNSEAEQSTGRVKTGAAFMMVSIMSLSLCIFVTLYAFSVK